MMQDEYEVKIRAKMGPGPNDDKSVRILNRCIEWRKDGIAYEADPRHAEMAVREMEVQDGNSVNSPGTKNEPN